MWWKPCAAWGLTPRPKKANETEPTFRQKFCRLSSAVGRIHHGLRLLRAAASLSQTPAARKFCCAGLPCALLGQVKRPPVPKTGGRLPVEKVRLRRLFRQVCAVSLSPLWGSRAGNGVRKPCCARLPNPPRMSLDSECSSEGCGPPNLLKGFFDSLTPAGSKDRRAFWLLRYLRDGRRRKAGTPKSSRSTALDFCGASGACCAGWR